MGYIHSVLPRPGETPIAPPIEGETPAVLLVDTLPEPSADTMGVFYVIVDLEHNTASLWMTIDTGSAYNWYPFGQKGEPGDRGPAGVESVQVRIVNTSLTPTATCTLIDGVLRITLSGIKGDKGDQGDSGYSGDISELQIVNNTRTGGATAALSAEAGKNLQEQLDKFIVISEDDYDDLVANDEIDPTAFYFIKE